MSQIDPLAVAIGTAVRGAITEAGLTNTSFAHEAGFALNSLSRRINGHQPFDFPELVRVANVTGVPLMEIVARAERILERRAA